MGGAYHDLENEYFEYSFGRAPPPYLRRVGLSACTCLPASAGEPAGRLLARREADCGVPLLSLTQFRNPLLFRR